MFIFLRIFFTILTKIAEKKKKNIAPYIKRINKRKLLQNNLTLFWKASYKMAVRCNSG